MITHNQDMELKENVFLFYSKYMITTLNVLYF